MRTASAESAPLWYRDRATLNFITLRYMPLLGVFNLLWEIAQLPFYTLWQEAPASFIAYAVVHCTLGDVAIGTLALLIALIATRARAVETWKSNRVALILVIAAVGYTVLSEWLNIVIRIAWQYSALMPVLRFDGFAIGLSPLLQWIVIPPVVLRVARARYKRTEPET